MYSNPQNWVTDLVVVEVADRYGTGTGTGTGGRLTWTSSDRRSGLSPTEDRERTGEDKGISEDKGLPEDKGEAEEKITSEDVESKDTTEEITCFEPDLK